MLGAGAAGPRAFQLGDLAFQRIQLLAGAQQHRALDVEFLAGHQIEPAEAGLQHRLEVLLQFLAAVAQALRHQVAEAAGEVVELAEVDHGVLRGYVSPASRSVLATPIGDCRAWTSEKSGATR